MNTFAIEGVKVFEWVVQTSWQAAVLAGVILVGQGVLGKRLSPPWRYGLWLLLVVRLLMPASPPSALSVFNVVKLEPPTAKLAGAATATLDLSSQRPTPARLLPSGAFDAQGPNTAPGAVTSARKAGDAPVPSFQQAAAAGRGTGPHRTGPWTLIAFWAWLAGCVALCGRLTWLHLRFRARIARHATVRDMEACRLFETCRQTIGIKQNVRLIETEEVETPAVYGLWRKCLLLPDGIFERFTPAELKHIFLHELAHIRRRDPEVNWVTSILQAVHWFNPVLWFAFARMRADRELATDALALGAAREADSTEYGETLLKVLAGLQTRPGLPGLVGIAEDKTRMKARLRAIARFGTGKTWRWAGVLALIVTGTVALTDAMSSASKPELTALENSRRDAESHSMAAASPEKVNKKQFALRISDFDTLAPLSGVEVQLELEYNSQPALDRQMTTDDKGLVSFTFSSADLKRVSYRTEKAGYLSLQGEWFKQQIGLLPGTLELKLGQGTEIGGTVMDQKGQPLAGAEIFFDRPMNMYLVYDHQVASQIWNATAGERLAITDENGAWRSRCIWPTVQWAALRVRHRGFADASYSTETTKAMELEGKGRAVTFGDLTAKRARFSLAPGLSVQGRVVDPAGQPVTGAVVRYADRPSESPFWDRVMGKGTVTTDALGKFKVDDLPARHIFFSVQVPGYAPAVGELNLDASHREIELRLADSQELTGAVVDRDRNPVSGVHITFEDWSIWQGVRWSAVTDENGRFEWQDAPPQNFRVLLEKDGFIAQHKILQAGGQQEIQINPVLKLSGKVKDAKSGQPVQQFRIFWADRLEYLPSKRAMSLAGTGGNYALDLGQLYADGWEHHYFYDFVFRVEADGYVPATSRVFSQRNGDVGNIEYEVEMQPARMISGTVLDPAGQPVAGAQLALKTPTARLRLAGKPQFEDLDKQPFHSTDGAGQFRIGVDPAATHLLAVHPKGFARIELGVLTDSAVVRLEPWGKIEGTVWQYDTPLPNEKVFLQWRQEGGYIPGSIELVHMETASDADGRFQFSFVPPGKGSIYRWIPMPNGASGSSSELVQIKAGQTSVVKVGGKGRPIEGRFRVKNPYVPIDWQKDQHTVGSVMPRPPEGIKSKEEHEAWRKQPEIQHAFETARNYPVLFAADGSFRIDEVLPGKYQFWIRIYDPTDPDAFAYSRYIASFNGTFEVPDGAEQNSRKLFDAGEFELTLNPKIEVGQTPAPQFTASDLAGKEFKLADFRGKYVVLDFWATWCGPCIADMPYLKQAYDKFKNRRDLVMISLSLDKSAAEPRAFVEKNGLPWTQGYLGPWEKSDVPRRYGVQGIPALFLIDPEGTILAKEIAGHALAATLQKHLK